MYADRTRVVRRGAKGSASGTPDNKAKTVKPAARNKPGAITAAPKHKPRRITAAPKPAPKKAPGK